MTPEAITALDSLRHEHAADREERRRHVIAVDAADVNVCAYCGYYRQIMAGTLLDGHAVCVVSDEFKARIGGVMRGDPELGFVVVANALGVSSATVRAWYKWDERRRIAR